MAYLDRTRAELLMTAANLDALLLFSPESFYYATRASAGVATMWRKAGAVAVLIPADAGKPETAVISDLFETQFRACSHIQDIRISPIWVETTTVPTLYNQDNQNNLSAPELIQTAWDKVARTAGFNRPATFDPMICYQHLSDALSEHGLRSARIGFEGHAVSVSDYTLLKQSMREFTLVDASDLIAHLKMIKSSEEIDNLRTAVGIAEKGIVEVEQAICEGISRDRLAECWNKAVNAASMSIPLTGSWEYISVGVDPWGGNAAVQPGDLIKVDVGCLVNGYTSDTGRTFVLGKPDAVKQRLFDALSAGFNAGAERIRPGTPLSDVHAASLAAIRAAGFPGYTRGHFGHGLGYSVGSEQWPFISADSNVCFEPGMVMAFECPWYINGIGGMIIENQLLITDNGHEMMNQLPLELISINA